MTHLKNSAGKINLKNLPIILIFLNDIYIFHARYQTSGTQAHDKLAQNDPVILQGKSEREIPPVVKNCKKSRYLLP